MIEPGEALLATVGLSAVLERRPPTPKDIARSAQLEMELRAAVLGYLKGKKPRAVKVTDDDTPDELPVDGADAIGFDVPEDVVPGYVATAARALAYLRDLTPKRQIPALTERYAERTPGETYARRWAREAIEQPIDCLGDLDTLTGAHTDAIRAVYPTLWAALGLATGEALATADRDLTGREERAVARILGVRLDDVARLQSVYAQEAKEQRGGKSPQSVETSTPLQRTAAK